MLFEESLTTAFSWIWRRKWVRAMAACCVKRMVLLYPINLIWPVQSTLNCLWPLKYARRYFSLLALISAIAPPLAMSNWISKTSRPQLVVRCFNWSQTFNFGSWINNQFSILVSRSRALNQCKRCHRWDSARASWILSAQMISCELFLLSEKVNGRRNRWRQMMLFSTADQIVSQPGNSYRY